jgi:FixJ family two-component response regulator
MASGVIYVLDFEARPEPHRFDFLKADGLQVRPCRKIEELLEMHDPDRPSCLILVDSHSDVNPNRIRREAVAGVFDLPVIVITRGEAIGSAVQAMKQGAFHCVDNQVAPEILLEHVRAALSLSASALRRKEERQLARESISRFTPRERQVIHLVSEGLSTKDIAGRLNRSTKTIEAHRGNMIQKAGVRSLVEVVRLFVLAGGAH